MNDLPIIKEPIPKPFPQPEQMPWGVCLVLFGRRSVGSAELPAGYFGFNTPVVTHVLRHLKKCQGCQNKAFFLRVNLEF